MDLIKQTVAQSNQIVDQSFFTSNTKTIAIIACGLIGVVIIGMSFKSKFGRLLSIFAGAMLGVILVGGAASLINAPWGDTVMKAVLP